MTDTQEQQPSVTQTSQGQTVSDDTVIDLQYLFVVWLKWIWIPILLGGVGFYSGYRDLQAFIPESVASIVVEPNGVEKPSLKAYFRKLCFLASNAREVTCNFFSISELRIGTISIRGCAEVGQRAGSNQWRLPRRQRFN